MVEMNALIAPPVEPVEVSFAARDGAQFVWRQAGGTRRWDYVTVVDGKPAGGVVSIEGDFTPSSVRGAKAQHCIWSRTTQQARVFVSCSDSSALRDPMLGVVYNVLYSSASRSARGPEILGNRTECYRTVNLNREFATVCVAETHALPLRIDVDGPSGVEFEATEFNVGRSDSLSFLPSSIDDVVGIDVLNLPGSVASNVEPVASN